MLVRHFIFIVSFLFVCSFSLAQSHKSLFKKGETAYADGKFEDALQYFNQAIEKNSANTPISTQSKVRYYNYKGATNANLGNYEKAISDLTWSINYRQIMIYDEDLKIYKWESNKASSDYYWRGYSHYSLKNHLLAIEDLQISIQEDPNSKWALFYLGECLLSTEKYSEAIRNFNQAIAKGLRDSRVYNAKGRAYYHTKNYQQSLLNYEKAYEMDKNDMTNLSAQAMPLAYMGQYEQALQKISESKKSNSKGVSYFDFMEARIHTIFNKSAEAINSMDQAFKGGFENWDAMNLYYDDFAKIKNNPRFLQLLIDNQAMVAVVDNSANSQLMADLSTFNSSPIKFQEQLEEAQNEVKNNTNVSNDKDHFIKKVALVIGNANYNEAPLNNTLNDALLMANELRNVGFEVMDHYNLDKSGMRQAMRDFSKRLESEKGVALFYYAGHGMQSGGTNFLVPVNAQIESDFEIEVECVKMDLVLHMLQLAENKMNIVIMDACRNNPFGTASRSTAQRGFVIPQISPQGTIIAYSTSPGKTASDGDGSNGLYTSELVKAMRVPGLTIEEVFKKVRINVLKKSEQKQNPWENSSLVGDFYFRK